MTPLTFSRNERLHHRKAIQKVFKTGKGWYAHPVRILCMREESEVPMQLRLMVTVPSRNFKKAVTRNLLKRRMREAYRRNKPVVADMFAGQRGAMDIVLIYTAKEVCTFHEIEKGILAGIQYIHKHSGLVAE